MLEADPDYGPGKKSVLWADLGIKQKQLWKWQRIATLSDEAFEEELARDEPSTAALVKRELSAELVDNVQRVPHTDFERAKKMVEEAEATKVRTQSALKEGRGKKSGNRAAAKAVGVDEKTVRNAKKHVESAEAVPAFKNPA